jgi:hypothetical protein
VPIHHPAMAFAAMPAVVTPTSPDVDAQFGTHMENTALPDGVNHIAWLSKDAAQLGRFYAEVFDTEVGSPRDHGHDGNETMTIIRIGPHTELNIFVNQGQHRARPANPMGAAAASITSACKPPYPGRSSPSGNG